MQVTTVEGRIYRAKRQLRRLLLDEGAEFIGEPHGGDLDRRNMLSPADVAAAMLSVIAQPPSIYTDEIVLMPPLGIL